MQGGGREGVGWVDVNLDFKLFLKCKTSRQVEWVDVIQELKLL